MVGFPSLGHTDCIESYITAFFCNQRITFFIPSCQHLHVPLIRGLMIVLPHRIFQLLSSGSVDKCVIIGAPVFTAARAAAR